MKRKPKLGRPKGSKLALVELKIKLPAALAMLLRQKDNYNAWLREKIFDRLWDEIAR